MKSPITKIAGYIKNKIENKRLEKILESINEELDELDYTLDWSINYSFDDPNYLKMHNPENEKIYKELVQKIEKLKILYPKGVDKFNDALKSASGCYECYLVNSNQVESKNAYYQA